MRKKVYLLLFILLVGIITVPVMAKGGSEFLADDNLTIEKVIKGTSFFAGNNVNISSEIDGISFVAGNNISLTSKQDYLFSAGNSLNLEGVEAKDAFLAGSSINIQQSKIRDLYAAAETIRIDSDISRDAYLGGNTVIINSKIKGNVNISAEKIELGEDAEVLGTLKVPDKAELKISNKDNVKKIKTYEVKDEESDDDSYVSTILSKVYACISMILIGAILLYMNPKVFKEITKIDKNSSTVLKTLLKGFGFLVLLPISCILLLCTVIGIPLSIICLLLYGIMIYLSVIPTAYYLGNWCLKDKVKNEYLVLIISLFVVYLLRVIPIVGGFVTFLSLIMGLGMYLSLIKEFSRKQKK